MQKKTKSRIIFNYRHFAKIVNAYEVLKDPKTRKVYD